MIHKVHDPIKNKFYEYTTTTEKEERLFQALDMALKDECPPDKKDYLCMIDATEEPRCAECIMRWATIQFGKFRGEK